MINPMDFLSSAKQYIGQSEVANRNSASRAYYCMYHLCLDIALKNGFEKYKRKFRVRLNKSGYHAKLIMFYKYKKQKDIAKLLNRMRKIRVSADYYLDDEFSIDKAEEQLFNAQELLKKIEPLKSQSF